MLSQPFALVGVFWLMWAMGFNISVAAEIGLIGQADVSAETGVVMLIHQNAALEKAQVAHGALTPANLIRAMKKGAVDRVRSKMMAVAAIMASLVPILWSTGADSEIMQRIAMPMIGGMVSSTVLMLAVIPALYFLVASRRVTPSQGEARSDGHGRLVRGESGEVQK